MTCDWHFTKLSLSSAALLIYFFLAYICALWFCSFVFVVFVSFIICSCWSFVDVPLIFSCPADRVHYSIGLATT